MRIPTSFRFVLPLTAAAVLVTACNRNADNTTATRTPPPATAPASTPATAPPATSTPLPGTSTMPAPAASAVSVTALDLGNAIGTDSRITTPSMAFGRNDTIYANVSTAGTSPSSTVVARWTFQDGQIVSEESKTIAPGGSEVTTFSISKPDGWPPGKYKLEILVDGQQAATREFDVT